MGLLIALVILLGAFSVLNLVLTLGVISRLRAQESAPGGKPVHLMLEKGATPKPFATTSIGGESVTEADLTNSTLVGFLSVTCKFCAEQVPAFLELAESTRLSGGRVLVVVEGDEEEALAYAAQFHGLATVVIDPITGPVSTAFGLQGWPAFGFVGEDRQITSSAMNAELLEVPDLAPAGR